MLSIQQHCVINLGTVSYYVRNTIERVVPTQHSSDEVTPAIVFHLSSPSLEIDVLKALLARFEAHDDVYTPEFMRGGVMIAQLPSSEVPEVPHVVQEYLSSLSSKLLFVDAFPAVPEGPYFLKGDHLHQAWRLYEDELYSFVSSVVPADNGREYEFQPLQAAAYSGLHSVVAVPSRLYFTPNPDKPLSGKRFTVKDNFHLAGIVTTMGSRSYAAYYGVQSTTSTYVQELLSKGAVVIGKTKMGAYTGSEGPPEKCIDYFPPWNPRGDGYQGPSGSSMGAGCATAGYDWVDASLGTDTTGSTRMPAASVGLWGIKASPAIFSLEHVMPSVKPFDSLGALARTSAEILSLYSATGSPIYSEEQKPTRILYPTDFFPMQNKAQQAMQEEFLVALEDYLQVQHEKVGLSDMWIKTGPESGRNQTLRSFMVKSGYYPNFYDGYHTYDQFIAGYQERFGKKAYASPFMTTRWQRGIDTTKEERDQALLECKTVAKWMFEHVLTPGTIMLIPAGRPGANYRDTIPEPGRGGPPETAFTPMYLPTTLGVPHLMIPIGQNPFNSRVSGNAEYAPIVASLIGVPGSDTMLLSVAQACLEKAGWPTTVLTGRNMFALGNNTRNSDISPSEAESKL